MQQIRSSENMQTKSENIVKRKYETMLKTKSNFTLWTTEYIFIVFDFNQIKYCNELLVPAKT